MIAAGSLIAGYALAAMGFSLLFLGVGFGFWHQIAATVAILCLYAFLVDRRGMLAEFSLERGKRVRALLTGLASATILYFVFMAGKLLAGLVFSFAEGEIESIYFLKQGVPHWLIVLLITLIIAPGEEIFWRGFIQRRLRGRYGMAGLVLAVLAYTSVHICSGNLMLIGAAFVCGSFWALLYERFQSLWANIFSHLLWDLAIFVLWPLA